MSEQDNFDDLDDMFDLDEPGPQDPEIREKIIELYQDATKILKPGIEKVKEKIRDSGISPADFNRAEFDYDNAGQDEDKVARGVVGTLSDLETSKKD